MQVSLSVFFTGVDSSQIVNNVINLITMKTAKTVSKSLILETAAEMTANDFINEFNSLITLDSIDNIMDANEGLVNVAIDVNDDDTIFILFADGKFDSYSY